MQTTLGTLNSVSSEGVSNAMRVTRVHFMANFDLVLVIIYGI